MRRPDKRSFGVVVVIHAVLTVIAGARAVRAATFTVTNANDSGAGSLRAAVAAAADGDTVQFDPALAGSTIPLTSGEIAINTSITISGLGSGNLGVNANLASRDFEVAAGKTVAISGLLVEGGQATGANGSAGGIGTDGSSGQGGGILNHGNLTVTACNFFKNYSSGGNGGAGTAIGGDGGEGQGGAIFNDAGATLQVNDCQFGLNSAGGGTGGTGGNAGGSGGDGVGGAIYSQGSLTVTGSLFDLSSCGGGDGGAGTGADSYGGSGGEGIGGAILAYGPTNISASQLTNNTVTGGTGASGGAGGSPGFGGQAGGGGLFVLFDVVTDVSTSTFANNSATGGTGSSNGGVANGGGIFNAYEAQLTLATSTISGNSATGGAGATPGGADGGGLHNEGTVTATNDTFTGNSSAVGGGVSAVAEAAFSLLNCTIDGNSASANGGGLNVGLFSGSPTLTNTIVAQNTAPTAPDGEVTGGTLVSGGHNVIGIAFAQNGGTFTAGAGDQIGTSGTPLDPKLNALGNNGGPTQTMALQLGSPALDHGDDAQCPAFDQTTITSRPQGAHCDVGAFELPTVTGPNGDAFTLTVIKIGLGTGTVTSAPTFGINCGPACAAAYFGGTSLDLTATPDPNSQFATWGGGCSGTNPVAPVVMNANTTCTAEFDPIPAIPAAGGLGLALLAFGLALTGWLMLRRG